MPFLFQEKKKGRKGSTISLPTIKEQDHKTQANQLDGLSPRNRSNSLSNQESANINLNSSLQTKIIQSLKRKSSVKQGKSDMNESKSNTKFYRGDSVSQESSYSHDFEKNQAFASPSLYSEKNKKEKYSNGSSQSLNRLHASQDIIKTHSSGRIHHEVSESLLYNEVTPCDDKSSREHQKKNSPVQDLTNSVGLCFTFRHIHICLDIYTYL